MLSLRDVFAVMENDKELRRMILGEDGDELYGEKESDDKETTADLPKETKENNNPKK